MMKASSGKVGGLDRADGDVERLWAVNMMKIIMTYQHVTRQSTL
jgi:hypothetical protein